MNRSDQDNKRIPNDDRRIREDVSKDLSITNRHKIKSDFDYSNERRPYDNSNQTKLRSFRETHLDECLMH